MSVCKYERQNKKSRQETSHMKDSLVNILLMTRLVLWIPWDVIEQFILESD